MDKIKQKLVGRKLWVSIDETTDSTGSRWDWIYCRWVTSDFSEVTNGLASNFCAIYSKYASVYILIFAWCVCSCFYI